MAVNRTGFYQTNYGTEIEKDVEAQLTYTFEWASWLDTGDTIASAVYSVGARRNDPTPVVIESEGVSGTSTYVELSGGQINKTYIVTCKLTTTNGLIDRRDFKLNVTKRGA
jgi:hypothetical protein